MNIVEFTANGAAVRGYLHDDHDRLIAHKVRPAMVVCPGGGYGHLSPREMDAPALEFFAMGYNTFLLHYSLGDQAGALRPLRQLAETVCTIRRESQKWRIAPDKIAVMGFSAGGHLTASLAALWNHPDAAIPSGCRPNAAILCYPVITMGQFTHPGTRNGVTGGKEDLLDLLSLEKHITPDCPPVFVWHTVDDGSVPVENTILLTTALQKAGIPFECHIFAHGPHGLSTCSQEVESPSPECSQWIPLAKTWVNNLFDFLP